MSKQPSSMGRAPRWEPDVWDAYTKETNCMTYALNRPELGWVRLGYIAYCAGKLALKDLAITDGNIMRVPYDVYKKRALSFLHEDGFVPLASAPMEGLKGYHKVEVLFSRNFLGSGLININP